MVRMGIPRDSKRNSRDSAWVPARLKHVTRLSYGDAVPPEHAESGEGEYQYQVFGSNGPYGVCAVANTGAPAIIVGRKGSYGKITWVPRPCFASDTTLFVDSSVCKHVLRWVYWLLQTLALDEGSDETAIPGLNREAVYAITVSIPPRHVQRAIADYLDRETARLDVLVAEYRKMLEVLRERRAAMITTAALRGLNPAVSFRDSGVPWIGDVPAHWEVWKLGHLASVGNGSTPNRGRREYWENGDVPWLNSSVVNQEEVTGADQYVTRLAVHDCHLPLVSSGSVILAITGQGKTRGRAAILSIDSTINQHLAFIRPQSARLSSWYLRWTLSAGYDYLRNVSDDLGGTKGALTCEHLANLRVPVPPEVEQRDIVTEIASRTRTVDDLSKETERTIGLLKERRSSLIAEAIAGSIDMEGESCG